MGLYQNFTHIETPATGHLRLDEWQSKLADSELLRPGTERYAEKVKRWADSSERPAVSGQIAISSSNASKFHVDLDQGAIVLAQSAEDIATTVRHTSKYQIDIATCGGGHSVTGASSSDGGIVVDLSLMRGVTVDPTSLTATAQGGCLWKDVDIKAAEYGLATVGGTVNHTGIGGLTLGGGYGWLSGEHGLTIDNLVAVQMVLADGSIITANEMKNADLFWAVRGAGHSFGITTEFTYRVHPQKEVVFGGQLALIPPKLPQLIEYINHDYEKTLGRTSITFGFAVAPPPISKPCIVVVLFHNGSEEEARKLFGPIVDLDPVMNMTGMMPYASINSMLNAVAHHGSRKAMKGADFATPLRPAFIEQIFGEFASFVTHNPDMAGSVILFECHHTAKICEVPHSATAFANRGQQRSTVLLTKWFDRANDQLGREQIRRYATLFNTEMQNRKDEGLIRLKMENVGAYSNYQNMGAKALQIYGPNTARLMALKAHYDPRNLFNKAHLQAPPIDLLLA